MIGERKRIRLEGFEEDLAEFTGDNFRFSDVGLRSIPLDGGRHLFVGQWPDIQGIAATVAELRKTDPTIFAYDPDKEPTIVFETNDNVGITPSPSAGSRHTWAITISLRLGRAPEIVKATLQELYEFYLDELDGARVGRFLVKGINSVQRPTVLGLQDDGHVIATSIVTIFGVPFPF